MSQNKNQRIVTIDFKVIENTGFNFIIRGYNKYLIFKKNFIF